MRYQILAAATCALLLAGCGTAFNAINRANEAINEQTCDDKKVVRFARYVLLVERGIDVLPRDCDGDGQADDLGRWVPPETAAE